MKRCQALVIFLELVPLLWICSTGHDKVETGMQISEKEFRSRREQMVEIQIAARGVTDTLVLNAMRTVPRHRYVPDDLHKYAYSDEPLPIGWDQTISQPYIVAYMTAALELKGDERVLEIGTGSGYQAAVLAEIADTVHTIEIVEPLAKQAQATLLSQHYENIICRVGDGFRGWPDQAPFDAIIVTAAPPEIPEPLIAQLAEGGRMIVPVGKLTQELVLIRKVNGKIRKERMLPVRFVPMTGEAQKKKD